MTIFLSILALVACTSMGLFGLVLGLASGRPQYYVNTTIFALLSVYFGFQIFG
mgnify:CR=1 FL=1